MDPANQVVQDKDSYIEEADKELQDVFAVMVSTIISTVEHDVIEDVSIPVHDTAEEDFVDAINDDPLETVL